MIKRIGRFVITDYYALVIPPMPYGYEEFDHIGDAGHESVSVNAHVYDIGQGYLFSAQDTTVAGYLVGKLDAFNSIRELLEAVQHADTQSTGDDTNAAGARGSSDE